MSVSAFPYGCFKAPGGGSPTVSPNETDILNSSVISTVYATIRYDNAGDEWTNTPKTALNYSSSRGAWLDTGSASDVWVQFTVTAGGWTSSPGTGRLNLGTTRSGYTADSNPTAGVVSVTCTMDFWDAASGGNNLYNFTGFVIRAAYTDSCPLCCFTPETPVLMASGLWVPIKDVRKGDLIVVADSRGKLHREVVTGVITRVNREMFRLHFSDGSKIDASADHPFHVKGKGPASINNYGVEYKAFGLPDELKVGMKVSRYPLPGYVKLVRIEPLEYPGTVFTLENSQFFANGLLVY